MREGRSQAELRTVAADIRVDAVVANAMRANGHHLVETIATILAHHDGIGIDLLSYAVDVDLGYTGADGTVVKDYRWEPAGRYHLGRTGLRSISMPLTRHVRWAGPGRRIDASGGGFRTVPYGTHLVVDHAGWPDTFRAACIGRPLHHVVDHPWLRVEGLVVRDCTMESGEHFAKLWVDEIMVDPVES